MLTLGRAQLTQVSQMRVERPASVPRSEALFHWKAQRATVQLALVKLRDA